HDGGKTPDAHPAPPAVPPAVARRHEDLPGGRQGEDAPEPHGEVAGPEQHDAGWHGSSVGGHRAMSTYKNYVNGEWVDGPDVNRDVNPSTLGDVVGEYTRADGAQARAAIAAARAAHHAWSRGSIQQRADLLDRIGAEILARKDELGRLLSREEGKTLP